MTKGRLVFEIRPITFAAVMKGFISVTLILCLLSQAFIRTAWTLHYQWNRALYIAQCEILDKPELNCDGQCCLKKEIAVSENNSKRDTNEPQLPGNFHLIKDTLLFFEYRSDLPLFFTRFEPAAAFPPFEVFLPAAPGQRVFKPPGTPSC